MVLRVWFIAMATATLSFSQSKVRVKDMTSLVGIRDNQLIGIGLVIGLNGTGDVDNSVGTSDSLRTMISKLGVKLADSEINSQSVAMVTVTAKLPAFAQSGDTLDVKLSILGSATSLAGGTLVFTPLKAANGMTFAIAQGAVVVGSATGINSQSLTVATIPRGATVEAEKSASFLSNKRISLKLKDPDFTTNARIVKAINHKFRQFCATSEDPAIIAVDIPEEYENRKVDFISLLENVEVLPASKAMVVINEKTGTIVLGSDVRISQVAISHGDLSIEVGEGLRGNSVVPLDGSTVGQFLETLNSLGVRPPDLINILHTLDAAGAIHGTLVVK